MQEMLTRAIRELYAANLDVKKDEKVLVFTDTVLSDEDVSEKDKKRRQALVGLARQVADTGSEVCRNITFLTYPSLKVHGSEPPRDVWLAAFGADTVKALEDCAFLEELISKKAMDEAEKRTVYSIVESNSAGTVNVVIALSNFSTSHTKFRDLLTNICKVRYASMPLFDEAMFYGPMQVDGKALEKRTNDLAACMNNAEKVFVTAPNGTNLVMEIKGRKILADTGNLTTPGAFGNLPAGEVFVAPVEGTTEGIMVLEWAPTARLASPITVKIEKGLVKDITGDDPYVKKLESKLKENQNFRNIAELGIGTNDMAKKADNILESEKILGTVHIAFGDNSTFGGSVRTPFHQDFVIFNPEVKIVQGKEEKIILQQGRLLS